MENSNKKSNKFLEEMKHMGIGSLYGFFLYASYNLTFIENDLVSKLFGIPIGLITLWIISRDIKKIMDIYFPLPIQKFDIIDLEEDTEESTEEE